MRVAKRMGRRAGGLQRSWWHSLRTCESNISREKQAHRSPADSFYLHGPRRIFLASIGSTSSNPRWTIGRRAQRLTQTSTAIGMSPLTLCVSYHIPPCKTDDRRASLVFFFAGLVQRDQVRCSDGPRPGSSRDRATKDMACNGCVVPFYLQTESRSSSKC